MRRLLTAWGCVAVAVVFSAMASSVNAQTIVFDGEIFDVSDPTFVDPAIQPGSAFTGSATFGDNINVVGGIPGLTVYDVDAEASIVIEGFEFTLQGLGLSAIVVIANDFPIGPFGVPADFWLMQTFVDESFEGISVDHGCFVVLQTTDTSRLSNTDFFVPEDLASWPPDFANNIGSGMGCSPSPPVPGVTILGGPLFNLARGVSVNADAGSDQNVECASPAGNLVSLDASGSDAPLDALYSWTEPTTGQEVEGILAEMLLPLGVSTVTLTVSIPETSSTDTVAINVRDTVAPNITADMVQAGEQGHKYDIVATASDVCDPAPVVAATVGANVSDGASITVAKPDEEGVVRFMSSMVELNVTATDASGNSATASASP